MRKEKSTLISLQTLIIFSGLENTNAYFGFKNLIIMGPIKTSTGPYCWAVIQVWSKSNSLLNFKKCYRYSLATVKNHAPTLLSHLVINWNPSHKARLCFRFGNQRERERERENGKRVRSAESANLQPSKNWIRFYF